jgi:hypothetical protein
MKKILLAVLLVFSLLPCAFASKNPTLAVLDLTAKDVPAEGMSQVYNSLYDALSKSHEFDMVDHAKIEQTLADNKLQLSDCSSDECAVKIGKMLNCQKIVVGNVEKTNAHYYLHIKMLNVGNGYTASSLTTNADTLDSLKATCSDIADMLVTVKTETIKPVTISSSKRKKTMFWYGIALAAAGTFCLVDGLQRVNDLETQDVSNASYSIANTKQTVTTTVVSGYYNNSVTNVSGTITNTGNTNLSNISILGQYVDANGVVDSAVVSATALNTATPLTPGQSETWTLPDDTNFTSAIPTTFSYSIYSINHTPIYAQVMGTKDKNDTEAVIGGVAIIAGGYFILDYLFNKDEDTALNKQDLGFKIARHNDGIQLMLTKRI